MAPRDEIIEAEALKTRLRNLAGWEGTTAGISKTYPIGWDEAAAVIVDIIPAAIELEHRPDLDIRWGGLTVHLVTHTAQDVVTELDLITAERLDQIVARRNGTTSK